MCSSSGPGRVAVGMGIPMGIHFSIWQFPYGWEFILAYENSHMWESFVRVAVGMEIPIGFPYGWEWEFILAYGNSHMWESFDSALP